MKLSLLAVTIFTTVLFTPFSSVFADETPQTIRATVNVRYQGSLVWTGDVDLNQGSTLTVTDDTGAARTVASDSALAALEAADTQSSDFSLSDLAYYTDYGSFYIKCLDIAAVPVHACDNWQYVANSAYPPVGAGAYTVSNGDTLYFYFGSPRRVVLTTSTVTASTSLDVTAQTYNYTNDTWQPLAGVQIGATQPNPNDQYSPLVIVSAISGTDGIAHIVIPTVGTYSVGLASDYYYPAELLTVTAPVVATTETQTIQISAPFSSSRSSGGSSSVASTIVSVNTPVAPAPEVKEATIDLGVSIDTFIKNYKEISARTIEPTTVLAKIVPPAVIAVVPAPIVTTTTPTQTASVADTHAGRWFNGLLKLFGF
jgi:hypothetical protein